MNNYSIFVSLSEELLSKSIYATNTIQSNCIGILNYLKNAKKFNRSLQGFFKWRMHSNRTMSCVMWKDKLPILLLSTHVQPVKVMVFYRHGAIRENIPTSPVLIEYTNFMRG